MKIAQNRFYRLLSTRRSHCPSRTSLSSDSRPRTYSSTLNYCQGKARRVLSRKHRLPVAHRDEEGPIYTSALSSKKSPPGRVSVLRLAWANAPSLFAVLLRSLFRRWHRSLVRTWSLPCCPALMGASPALRSILRRCARRRGLVSK